MLRLTLAQMRRSVGRLAAAGIAIAIGTAFVAATLLAGNVLTRTSYDAIAASYADADLVVTGDDLTGRDLDNVRALPGVAAADSTRSLWAELQVGAKRVYPLLMPQASDPRLDPQTLTDGRLPAAAGELALPDEVAERLGVGIGDEVTANRQAFVPAVTDGATVDPASADGIEPDGEWEAQQARLTVVGLLDDPHGAYAQVGGAAVLSAADAERWTREDNPGHDADLLPVPALLVVLDPGADLATARESLAAAVPDGSTVRTKDEQAVALAGTVTNGANVFTLVVLGFASVALVVAALVIANTFQVLIAQRTRTLALLRCVGADRRQLRRSVLLEAGVLGLASSVAGLLGGVLLAQVALAVLSRMNLDVPLPTLVQVTPRVVLAPLLVGTVVTVLASLVPARAATRVAPLAALRPADAPTVTARASRGRLVLAALATVGGAAVLVLGVVAGQLTPMAGLLLGLLGGAVSFVGLLVGAVFWVPRVVGMTGRLLAGTGSSARIAAANSVRNPRRTAATSTALLIGVTLVAMMSTGAASARSTLGHELDDQYPVDISVVGAWFTDEDGETQVPVLDRGVAAAVRAVDGVAEAVELPAAQVSVTTPAAVGGSTVDVRAVSPQDARSLVRATEQVDGLADGTVLVPTTFAEDWGLDDGDTVTLTVAGDAGGSTEAEVVVTSLPSDGLLVTPATLATIAPDAPASRLWARLADVSDAGTVVPHVQDALADTAVEVTGAAVERAGFQRLIDTLLAIVVGLLAVAVVIALVGVANTLSLSVLERRRESATLRAIGLSRRQLRTMLAIEGMLIAGVGAVLGAGIGLVYGWAGASSVLGVVGEVDLAVPWRDLGLVVVVALGAGLLASVLPARTAVRTSPVAALAVD